MSYQIGLDTICLRPTPRLAHTEYCSNDALFRVLNVVEAKVGPQDQQFTAGTQVPHTSRPKFVDVWHCDLIWSVNDGPVPWGERGRVTDMGHADFLEGGIDRRMSKPCPFDTAEEVLAFDAVKEYGLPDFNDLVKYYQQSYDTNQRQNPEQVFTAGYYKTIVSGAIEAFGWDMLLEAAADRDGFAKVLDSFFRLSKHHYRAWAQTTAPVFICHDDFVWSEGPFMHPDVYRREIIPRYRELWAVLHQAGKKVLFCSDANWIEFLDDIAAAGADGFIFEPMMPLEPVVERYGKTHFIAASKVDARTLTFGTREQIAAEVDATLPLAFKCPGFMFAVGNHIPSNVPVENALFYFDYLKQRWNRG